MRSHILYLHGFASSPGSTKAAMFRDWLSDYNADLIVPDLNVPDFQNLTLTAMLSEIGRTIRELPEGDVYLIGSSFGGLAAVHFLDRQHQVEAAGRVRKLMLMAPALDFLSNRSKQLGEDALRRWQADGYLTTYHYAYQQELPVHYGLVEDVRGYDSYNVQVDLPILIYHGRYDDSVNYQQSVHFAEGRPNVDLRLVESDHSLMDQTETIFNALVRFFELERAR